MHKRITRHTVWLALFAPLALLLMFFFYRSGSWTLLPEYLEKLGHAGIVLSYLLVVLQTMVPFVPFAILAGMNATAHGFFTGYLATLFGSFTGSLLLYGLSKSVLRPLFSRYLKRFFARHAKLQATIARIDQATPWSTFFTVLGLRLQFWLPASIIDLSAGISSVSFVPFLFGTLIGQAIMVLLESYVGHRVLHFKAHVAELAGICVIGGGILAANFIVARRKMRRLKS
ncbi:TVP38/TMEM64 family protein [Ferroacidibacillus organovorans]|uniref:TVP38/TMEM64 family membrane protein n=1 Tax=Ferroacidibacillus organovorans TaxID=1765683 RepID=A0A101XP37_9BACL|nr:VTT domain-containing protein [Ferroacidibacillus organovorans]KUO94978.1 hypothetical protein ATW55_04915 [Ferroacidibacillus organovorans]